MVSPLALFAGVPAFAAPAGLRERVLSSVTLEPGGAMQSAPTGGSARRRWTIMGGVAAVIIGLIVLLVPGRLGEGIHPEPVDAPITGIPAPRETPSPTPPTAPPSIARPAPPPNVETDNDEGDEGDSDDSDDSDDTDDEPDREPGREPPEPEPDLPVPQ
jgi:hypothetical protein